MTLNSRLQCIYLAGWEELFTILTYWGSSSSISGADFFLCFLLEILLLLFALYFFDFSSSFDAVSLYIFLPSSLKVALEMQIVYLYPT